MKVVWLWLKVLRNFIKKSKTSKTSLYFVSSVVEGYNTDDRDSNDGYGDYYNNDNGDDMMIAKMMVMMSMMMVIMLMIANDHMIIFMMTIQRNLTYTDAVHDDDDDNDDDDDDDGNGNHVGDDQWLWLIMMIMNYNDDYEL